MLMRGSAPPPGPREPGAARRPTPATPSAPSRPQRRLPRPGRPAPGAGPVGPQPCMPATGQVTLGPQRGRPGPRTALVPLKVGVETVEGVVSLASPALQLLPPTSEVRRASVRKNTNAEKAREGISKSHEAQLTWKMRHAGPLWIRNASFRARLSEAPWSRSSCQSPCSA
jgi:hypothetical protein